jgi:hypothetical protein
MHQYLGIYRAADQAIGRFLEWAGDFEPREKFTCMFDVFEAWLNDGTAVDDCCQDFQTFLTAVTLIIGEWHNGFTPKEDWPELNRITRIMDPEHYSYGVLDPQAFMMAHDKFRTEQWQLHDCRLPKQN